MSVETRCGIAGISKYVRLSLRPPAGQAQDCANECYLSDPATNCIHQNLLRGQGEWPAWAPACRFSPQEGRRENASPPQRRISDLVQIQVREFRGRHQFIIMRVRHIRYGKAVLELGEQIWVQDWVQLNE